MPKRGRGPRLTLPRKSHARRPPPASSGFSPGGITDGDVQWAAVQVDEAAERLKAAERGMLDAQKELADDLADDFDDDDDAADAGGGAAAEAAPAWERSDAIDFTQWS